MKKKYLLTFIIFISVFFCLNVDVKADTTCSYTLDNYPFKVTGDGTSIDFSTNFSSYVQYRRYIYELDDVVYNVSKPSRANKNWHNLYYNTNLKLANVLYNYGINKNNVPIIQNINYSFKINDNGEIIKNSMEYYIYDGKKKFNVSNISRSYAMETQLKKTCPDIIVLDNDEVSINGGYYNVPQDRKNAYSNASFTGANHKTDLPIFVKGLYLSDYHNNLDMLFAEAEKLYPDVKGTSGTTTMKLILYNSNSKSLYENFWKEKSCLLHAYYNFNDKNFSKSKAGEIVEKYLENSDIRYVLTSLMNSEFGTDADIRYYFAKKNNIDIDKIKQGTLTTEENKKIDDDIKNFYVKLYDITGNVSEEVEILEKVINGPKEKYDNSWYLVKCENNNMPVDTDESKTYFAKERDKWIKKYTNYNYGSEQYLPYLLDILINFETMLDDDTNGKFYNFYNDLKKNEEILDICNSASDNYDANACPKLAGEYEAEKMCNNVSNKIVDLNGDGNITEEEKKTYDDILSKYDSDKNSELGYYEIKECIESEKIQKIEEAKKKDVDELLNDAHEEGNKLNDAISTIVKDHTVIVKQTGIDIEKTSDICELLDKKGNLYKYMMIVFNLIRIGGPILVIFLTGFDAIKSFASFKDDDTKKFWSHLKTRLICVALLILVPTVINFLIDLFAINTCKYIQ